MAFQAVKQAMIIAPVLDMPNFLQPFVIETNASRSGLGVHTVRGDAYCFSYCFFQSPFEGSSTVEVHL